MSALTIIRAVFEDVGISDTIEGRIYPEEIPQDSILPAIALHLVSEADGRGLVGHDRYPVARIIVDSCGQEWADANDLGEIVKLALRDYVGNAAGRAIDDIALDDVDFFDKGETGKIWRRRQGFRMRYR